MTGPHITVTLDPAWDPLPMHPCPHGCGAQLGVSSSTSEGERGRCGKCKGETQYQAGELRGLPGQHWWVRTECDARLIPRKIARRATRGYAVTGSGWGQTDDGREFATVTLVAQIIAPTRQHALSELVRDLPGCVVSICDPTDPAPPAGRFEGLLPWAARPGLATPEMIAAAEAQIAQIEARGAAHAEWMAANARTGRTDDAAAQELHRRYPWPEVRPAYSRSAP